MVRLVTLGALAATCAQATSQGNELFIGPFYSLNETVVGKDGFDDVSKRFREAYCTARNQGDTESYTTVFNTVVATPDGPHQPRYYTREEFKDGDTFNTHLYNVRNAFANAKGVSINTGFFALGTEDDLHAIRINAENNRMTTFVKDAHSFKNYNFIGDDYFSVDFFMDVPRQNLTAFKEAWRQTRDAAWTKDGILSFAMGVHESEDGSYTVVCQETYASAAAYLDWYPEGQRHLEMGTVTDYPNPFTMTGRAEQLAMVKDKCDGLPFTCLQYTFDTCEGVGDISLVMKSGSDATPDEVESLSAARNDNVSLVEKATSTCVDDGSCLVNVPSWPAKDKFVHCCSGQGHMTLHCPGTNARCGAISDEEESQDAFVLV